jgi:hypothetical protein
MSATPYAPTVPMNYRRNYSVSARRMPDGTYRGTANVGKCASHPDPTERQSWCVHTTPSCELGYATRAEALRMAAALVDWLVEEDNILTTNPKAPTRMRVRSS